MSYNSEPFTIGVLGDSLSAGYGWQYILQEKLNRVTNRPVIFYDWANSGFTAELLLNNMANNVVRCNPNIILLQCGSNDAANSVPVTTFSNNIQAMINLWKARNYLSNMYLMTMNPSIPPAPSAAIANKPALMQALRELAASNTTGLIDMEPLWGTPTNAQIPDGSHPTDAAVRAITVPAIYSVVQPLVTP